MSGAGGHRGSLVVNVAECPVLVAFWRARSRAGIGGVLDNGLVTDTSAAP